VATRGLQCHENTVFVLADDSGVVIYLLICWGFRVLEICACVFRSLLIHMFDAGVTVYWEQRSLQSRLLCPTLLGLCGVAEDWRLRSKGWGISRTIRRWRESRSRLIRRHQPIIVLVSTLHLHKLGLPQSCFDIVRNVASRVIG
jgi:hypothetical protein